MKLQALRLGATGLLLISGMLWQTLIAVAQDQGTLANTANSAMREMASDLSAALRATSETTAKNNVRAAIAAGERAIVALDTLRKIATDDVVRSRSEAAKTQTQDAVNKAKDALGRSGDAFTSGVQAALAEVNEAIGEFAPVLNLVSAPAAAAPARLPSSGMGDLTQANLLTLGLLGLALLGLGGMLRQRALSRP